MSFEHETGSRTGIFHRRSPVPVPFEWPLSLRPSFCGRTNDLRVPTVRHCILDGYRSSPSQPLLCSRCESLYGSCRYTAAGSWPLVTGHRVTTNRRGSATMLTT